MRAGGALFVARSNSPEFGLGGHTYNPVYGTTRNAFDPSRSAGGSSGGAGGAVALRALPLGGWSVIHGSVRTPAPSIGRAHVRTPVNLSSCHPPFALKKKTRQLLLVELR